MNKFTVTKTEHLLYLGVVILALISAYTTADGFNLIWNSEDLVGNIIAWSFAVAISSILVFCNLKVHQYFKERKIAGLIIAYIFFASISMFFNFNAIYGKYMTNRILYADLKKIKNNVYEIHMKALQAIDSEYKYSYWAQQVDTLEKRAEAEAINVLRIGKGRIYQQIVDEKVEAMAEYNASKNKYELFKNKIEALVSSANQDIDNAGETIKQENLRHTLERCIDKFNEIGIITHSVTGKFTFEPMTIKSNLGKPDYALITLEGLFSREKRLTLDETRAVWISLFLSFLLDFPLFFAIVVINWPLKISNDIFGKAPNRNNSMDNVSKINDIRWD